MKFSEALHAGMTVSFYTLRTGWQYFLTLEEAVSAREELIGTGLDHRTFLYDMQGRVIAEEGLSSRFRLNAEGRVAEENL